ncbi:MAG: replication-relaxation family protein [Myxococcota bacterium]|nr:replication-relaxation family protein [Myxococcota bacterium]
MTRRRSRRVRPVQRRYQVTDRDRQVLAAVGRMGQATSEQLRRLFFGDPSTASRRLAKLVALRMLDVHVLHENEPNVFTLGTSGVTLLVNSGHERATLHRSRVGQQRDRHLELLNDVRIELLLATRGRSDVELVRFHADLDLRRAAGAAVPAYIPDAIAELRLGAHRLALVVEVDSATEGLRVFARKAETTVTLWREGLPCWGAAPGTWRPAVFVPSGSRARALARVIEGVGAAPLWLVTEFTVFRERGALGPVFATATDVVNTPRGVSIPYQGALAPALTEATTP